MAFLRVLQAGGLGGRVATFAGGDAEITIGRGETNDLVLEHPTVSRLHARVVSNRLGFLLVDEGSTNGTRVAGERVEKQFLVHGDRVSIGAFELEFDAEGDTLARPRAESAATVRQCARCGVPLQPGNLYCGRCGARLGDPVVAPEPLAGPSPDAAGEGDVKPRIVPDPEPSSPGEVVVRAPPAALAEEEAAGPLSASLRPRETDSEHRQFKAAQRDDHAGHLRPGRVAGLAPGARRHRPWLAVLSGLLIPGAGQAYNGQVAKAFLLLLTSVLVVPWIYSLFDAHGRARAIVETGGRLGRGGLAWVALQALLFLAVLLAIAIGLILAGVLV